MERCKNAKVFYRILPTIKKHQWQHVKILEDMQTVYVRCLQDFRFQSENDEPRYWKFITDGLFFNNTQAEVYEKVMSGVLDRVLQGSNAVIVAYGQPASGKTLTASGVHNSFQDRGIAPRAISELFRHKKSLKGQHMMCIKMSYVEIGRIFRNDLLNPNQATSDWQILKRIKAIKVRDEYQALKLLFKAEGRRQFLKNTTSHTATGILTFHVVTKMVNQTDAAIRTAKLHLVDSAGIDNYGNVLSLYKSLFEVGGANLAKSHLEQFIVVLCHGIPEQILIKQRLNLLIQYLGDSLSADSILRFVGHIRTDRENLLITLSLLRFGQLVQGLKPKRLKIHEGVDKAKKITMLEDEIKRMQTENDLNVMLNNADLSHNLTQQRIKHMQNVAEEFLHDQTNDMVVLNVTNVTTVLKVFKNLYNKLEAEKVECTKMAYQKAYVDAMENIKRQPLLAESATSTKSLRSRKFSKSKESLERSSLKERKKSVPRTESFIKLPEHHSTSSKVRSQDNFKQLKRSKTSSINLTKRSISGRKKSTGSTTTAGSVKDTIQEETFSGVIPTRNEAWHQFQNVKGFKELTEILNTAQADIRVSRKNYLKEVGSLQELIKVVEIRENELQIAEMHRMLEKEKLDESGSPVITELENLCSENLSKSKRDVLEQQERILKAQAELRIAVDNYRSTHERVQDKFRQFCMEEFQMELPDLENSACKVVEELQAVTNVEEDEEEMSAASTAALKFEELAYYNHLKQIMLEEMNKKGFNKKKGRKWVQSCKP